MNEKEYPTDQPAGTPVPDANDCTYHLTKNQLPNDESVQPLQPVFPPRVADFPQEQVPENHTAESSPRTEYEYSFDSQSGRFTYTDHSASQPNPVQTQKKKNRVPLFLCVTALVLILSTLTGIVGGAMGASAFGQGNNGNTNLNSPVVTQTIVKVNNGEIPQNALMQAAAEAFDSVVVIDTFASQAAVDADEASGAGSGVIWTEDGYIVTCNHVIDGFTLIRVTLPDGSYYFADVVGTDAKTDLAVLKIAANGKLPSVTIRGTDLILAETVLAIGNPLGVLSNTVSSGILSCLTREISIEGQVMSLLQIDAAVNHGNSGGGLFDVNGSLIGIVNAKSTGESVEGIGFAIPIATVTDVCNQLIQQGYVTGRPQLGIKVATVNRTTSSYIFESDYFPDLKSYATTTYRDVWGRERTQIVEGVYIVDLSSVKGYKGNAELKYGDRILYVGKNEISSSADVLSALSDYNAGDTIQITVQRNLDTTIIVEVILGQKGATN